MNALKEHDETVTSSMNSNLSLEVKNNNLNLLLISDHKLLSAIILLKYLGISWVESLENKIYDTDRDDRVISKGKKLTTNSQRVFSIWSFYF